MNETIQMSLDSKLIKSLKKATAQERSTIDQTIQNLVAEYLDTLRRKQLHAQMERFRAQHADLLKQFRGEFIGFYAGRVLDHDSDGGKLYSRLASQLDELPILIVEVTESPEQVITVLTPHFEIDE